MRTEFLCIFMSREPLCVSVLRVVSGPRVKLPSCKSVLNRPPHPPTADGYSPELLQILMTLTTVIKPILPNVLGRAIVILNFVRPFRNFIADTVPC